MLLDWSTDYLLVCVEMLRSLREKAFPFTVDIEHSVMKGEIDAHKELEDVPYTR